MSRAFAALAALSTLVLGSVAAGAARPASNFGEPLPAERSTARIAVATGHGDQRLAIWTAHNTSGELCFGWRTGRSTAPPAGFTCLRRGLEPPLVAVTYGGGRGGQATWGVIAGVTSPRVARLAAQESGTSRELRLSAVHESPGWHAFAAKPIDRLTALTVLAYAGNGQTIASQDGGSIHPSRAAVPSLSGIPVPPPKAGQAPGATGPAWSDLTTTLPRAGRTARAAIPIALGDKTVQSILSGHEAWLVGMTGWGNCSGRRLGGVVSFRFATPATFTATLPAVGPPSGPSSYSTVVRRVRAAGWSTMHVWADTSAGAVVGVNERTLRLPYEDPTRTVTLETVEPTRDAGGPDLQAAKCRNPPSSG
jgi:hypothetical protein